MRIVVTGASGQLGAYLLPALIARGHDVVAWSGGSSGLRSGLPLIPVPLTEPAAVVSALDHAQPDAVIHAAAVSRNDKVLADRAWAEAVNVQATDVLASWCRARQCRFVFISTDLVFDGRRGFYRETDPVSPILSYGRTKADAERTIRQHFGGGELMLIARLPLLYGPTRMGIPTFFDENLAAIRAGTPRSFFADEFRTPLHYRVAADLLAVLTESDRTGILHVAGRERVSRYDLVRTAASALGLDPALVAPNRQADFPGPEPRPADVSLDTALLAAAFPYALRPTIGECVTSY